MITTYFKNLVADNVWKTAGATSFPDKYYLAMSSTQPMEDGTGVTEPSVVSGYARTEMTGLSAAADGEVKNEVIISWPKILTDQGQVLYWALYDSQEVGGGNLLMGDALDAAKHLDAGTTVSIEANGLTLRVVGA